MKFQYKAVSLMITVLSFVMLGIAIGSFLYAPKANNYLIYAGMVAFPALTLVLKARVKIK